MSFSIVSDLGYRMTSPVITGESFSVHSKSWGIAHVVVLDEATSSHTWTVTVELA